MNRERSAMCTSPALYPPAASYSHTLVKRILLKFNRGFWATETKCNVLIKCSYYEGQKTRRCYSNCWKIQKQKYFLVQWNLYKAEPHGTENIFHIGKISALYKINNTDSSGRDYRICSHWANFRLIQVPPYTSFTVYASYAFSTCAFVH
jgi:hypothetical protein